MCEHLVRLCLCFSRPLGVDIDFRDIREGSDTALLIFSSLSVVFFNMMNSLSVCFSNELSNRLSRSIVFLPIVLEIYRNFQLIGIIQKHRCLIIIDIFSGLKVLEEFMKRRLCFYTFIHFAKWNIFILCTTTNLFLLACN